MSPVERDLPISYARAADGAPVAWTRIGAGPPLLVVSGLPFTSFRLIANLFGIRRFLRLRVQPAPS